MCRIAIIFQSFIVDSSPKDLWRAQLGNSGAESISIVFSKTYLWVFKFATCN